MKTINVILIFLLGFTIYGNAQNSFYMEYSMIVGKGEEGVKSNSKTWHCDKGSRIENDMNIPGMGSRKTVMLMLKSNPGIVYQLDLEKKSYTEIKSDGDENQNNEAYTVEIIGKEKVAGYNCTHANVKSKESNFEVWTTKEIPDYQELLKTPYIKNSTKGANKSFMSGELEGMMVRMKNANKNESFTMELVKFEKGNFPANMFEIPAGYSKGMSLDPSKMQNMTPEERQKMMEELMKQYGKEEKH